VYLTRLFLPSTTICVKFQDTYEGLKKAWTNDHTLDFSSLYADEQWAVPYSVYL